MLCLGLKATLTQQPKRPTTALLRQHDNASAVVPGAMMGQKALDPLSYLGLATSRALRVQVVQNMAPGAVISHVKSSNGLQLVPHMKQAMLKRLQKARANISEESRHTDDEDIRKMREIKSRLMETVDSSICITRIKECKDMINNMYQPLNETVQEEGQVFAMDSDDEMALYEELDAMTEALERTEDENKSWELVAAKSFNQAARSVTGLEDSYQYLYHLLSSATKNGESAYMAPKKFEEVMLNMEHVAQAVAQLGASISSLDLDEVLEEVQTALPYLQSITPQRDFETRANQVQVWRLVASSASFRQAIIDMEINDPLVDLMSSMFVEVFTESEARALVRGSRRREIPGGGVLFDDSLGQHSGYWTLIISGNVSVSQVLHTFIFVAPCRRVHFSVQYFFIHISLCMYRRQVMIKWILLLERAPAGISLGSISSILRGRRIPASSKRSSERLEAK